MKKDCASFGQGSPVCNGIIKNIIKMKRGQEGRENYRCVQRQQSPWAKRIDFIFQIFYTIFTYHLKEAGSVEQQQQWVMQ